MIHNFQKEPNRVFSNFYFVTVRNRYDDDDILYPSVEHAYQASKSLDMTDRRHVAQLRTALEAKQAGRILLLRPDWESVKRLIMLDLLRFKFDPKRHPNLAANLVATGDQYLVEGNTWHDNYWGVCSCSVCRYERSKEEPNLGSNWLGRLLMHVRTELQMHPFFNQITQ